MNEAVPKITLPQQALRALALLEKSGYEAWCVGGFVRDSLLDRPTADVDIATNAPWVVTKNIFENENIFVAETGTKHGTVTVVMDSFPLEITTYRVDGSYRDHRHPDSVTFVQSIEEDLARRDFTINALAFHPKRGLLDPHGGMVDLRLGLIRTVGTPEDRFEEDALRILRGIRFSSQLGFTIEHSTFTGMLQKASLLNEIAAERLYHELTKFLEGAHVHDALMNSIDIIGVIIPEALPMKEHDQMTPYHIYDVLEHTAYVVENTPAYPLVRWSAFFHDIGKPRSFFTDDKGIGHFYGHAKISVEIAHAVAKRLKMPTRLTEDMLKLVKVHDDVIEPTPKAVKRALRRLGGNTNLFFSLCDLKKGDAAAQAPHCAYRMELADQIAAIARTLIEEQEAFSLHDLAIKGTDIIERGIKPGPEVGTLLDQALDAVIEEKIPNTKSAILSYLQLEEYHQ